MKFLACLFLLISVSVGPAFAGEDSPDSGAVINLQNFTNDLHAPFMGLKVGNALLEKKQKVTLFLNLEAARMADSNQPLDLRYGKSKQSIGDLLKEFQSKKGQIYLCPHCAQVAGIDKKSLRKGIIIATHDDVAHIFSTAEKVIDY